MNRFVSRETLKDARTIYRNHEEKLEAYLDQLLWWNDRLNLVSRSVSRETIRFHLLHSLLPGVMGLLESETGWIDAGTGGGLPGLPLAIAYPEKQWILNDQSEKKVVAVKQMIHSLGLSNAEGRSGSIEAIAWPDRAGVITKHAFPVDRLIPMIHSREWNRLIMYKGVGEPDVLAALRSEESGATLFRFDFGDDSFFEEKGVLVVDR